MTANIQIIGNVGNEPELVEFESGNKKATFTVCVNDFSQKDKDGNPSKTWFQIESWNGQTKNVTDLITKGREIAVTGKLLLQEYYSKKLKKHITKPVVKLTEFHLCGKKPTGDE